MPHENPNTDRMEPEDQPEERTAADEIDPTENLEGSTFQRKNVLDGADHQLEFFGSYTEPPEKDEGTTRTIEHEFEVYTDPEHRSEDGKPTAVIEERELMAPESEQRTGGDADLSGEERIEHTLDVDPELDDRSEQTAIEERCQQYQRERLQQVSSALDRDPSAGQNADQR